MVGNYKAVPLVLLLGRADSCCDGAVESGGDASGDGVCGVIATGSFV